MTIPRSGRPLVRPGFLKGSIVAFAILVPVAAYNVWDYVETRRLNAAIDTLIRNGEPIRGPYRILSDPEKEADRSYRAAAVLAEGLGSEMPMGFASRLTKAESSRDWPPEVIAQVRALADRYREPIGLAQRAAAVPFGGFLPGTEYNYRSMGLVSLARAVGLEAARQAIDGDAVRALDALAAEASLEPLHPFFSHIRFATDVGIVASRVRLQESGLARLATAIEGFDRDDRLVRELRRFRADILSNWQLSRGSNLALGYRIVPPWATRNINRQIGVFSRLMNAAEGPWPDRIDTVVAVGEWPIPGFRGDTRTILNSLMVRLAQDVAVIRATRVVVAVERYRRAHGEALPARLEELVPDYLPALPIDPFSGKPITLVSAPQRYVVYSVGANRRDEGGVDVDGGFAYSAVTAWPRSAYTADLGVRIEQR